MSNQVVMCWAPECAVVTEQPGRGRPQRYCSGKCRVRAVRRNGGKAPTEPYPPLLETSDTPPPVVAKSPAKARRTVKAPPRKPGKPPQTAGPEPEAVTRPPASGTVTQLHVAVTEDSTVPVTITVHPLVAKYKADLEDLNALESRQGLQVVVMAERLVSSATSPAAAASISKDLDRLMGELEQSSPAAMAERDPSLVIRERTLAKLRAVQQAPAERAG